jgi:aspartokinase/homoserine dehydrogenase 1
MKVLKFGGTSVANSESLSSVLKITQNQQGPIAVVVSALGGITDLLMEMLSLAQSGDDHYKDNLAVIEKRHLETIKNCVPIQHQSAIISFLKKHLNELESRLDAVHLLEEATPKNNSTISAYGEILSSNIIQEIFSLNKVDSVLKDSRELIKTSSHNGREVVDKELTNKLIQDYFKKIPPTWFCFLVLSPAMHREKRPLWAEEDRTSPLPSLPMPPNQRC